MDSMVKTELLALSEVAQDQAREAAFRTGYDDYLAGGSYSYPLYAGTALAQDYEKGAARAVSDVQAGAAQVRTVQDVVIARATTGRGYTARHRRVTA